VTQVLVHDGVATGVVLAGGGQIIARRVVSSCGPRRTFLGLVDPEHLTPAIPAARAEHPNARHARQGQLRGVIAARIHGAERVGRPTAGGSALPAVFDSAAILTWPSAPFDAAKYGAYGDELLIELTIPSLADPTLAPAGRHVVSAYVQFAPYSLRGTSWDAERERFGDIATRTIATYAPGFEQSILGRSVITPLDLERRYGLTGGHIFHGELALDQLFVARPLLGWARGTGRQSRTCISAGRALIPARD